MQEESLALIQNVYQRSLALERRIRLRELFPEGIIPYMRRVEAAGLVATPYGPSATKPPPTTTTWVHRKDAVVDFTKPYTYRPRATMQFVGLMDGYSFNSSVPKFDPWFRQVLKEKAPEVCEAVVNTYVRDPCTPDRVMKHFALFDRQWKFVPRNSYMTRAKALVARMFEPLGKIEPIDLSQEGWYRILPHMEATSSPGLPLRREYTTQGECYGHIYDKAKRLNHFAKFLPPYEVRAPPCMIGLRPGLLRRDELDTKIKARGVWAYPAEVKVVEMRYVIPLLERMSLCFGKTPYPVGRNMTKALPTFIDHLLHDKKWGLVTDISKLDTCVGPQYIDWAFDLIRSWYVMGFTQSGVTRNENVFDFVQYYFKRTPIVLPSGMLMRKAGGVPSGSGFTQIVDTLVTLLISTYALLKMGYQEEDLLGKMFAVGDDFAASVLPEFNIDEFAEILATLGFDINVKKVMFSNRGIELKFLGYSKLGGGVYRPIEELLQTAMFPEKFVGNPHRTRQRILGQVIASGLSNGFLSKTMQWLSLSVSNMPIDPGETYIPQKRWIKNVLGLENLPLTDIVFDLFPLV
jgi:hypothetical protein